MADEVIEFRCSECRSEFRVPGAQGGGWQFCPKCHVNIQIPRLSEKSASVPTNELDFLKELSSLTDRSSAPRTPSTNSPSKTTPATSREESPPPLPKRETAESTATSAPRAKSSGPGSNAAGQRKPWMPPPILEPQPQSQPKASRNPVAMPARHDGQLDDLEDYDSESDDIWEDAKIRHSRQRESEGTRSSPRNSKVTRQQSSSSPDEADESTGHPPFDWNLFGYMVLAEVGALTVGITLSLLIATPMILIWMIGLYVVAGLAMFGASWCLGISHAIKDRNYLSMVLFFFPWYFIRYAIRNLPETRWSMVAIWLGLVWLTAPFLIGLPISAAASLLGPSSDAPTDMPDAVTEGSQPVNLQQDPARPGVAFATDSGPQPPAADRGVNQEENLAPPQNPADGTADPAAVSDAQARLGAEAPPRGDIPGFGPRRPRFPVGPRDEVPTLPGVTGVREFSSSVETNADGTTTTTITENGRTTVTTRRSTLNPSQRLREFKRDMEMRRIMRERRKAVGDSFVLEIRGSDRGQCWGGKDAVYIEDSEVGVAAVHAGLVKLDQLAKVRITILPPHDEYPSLNQNGVRSHRWSASDHYNSFKIELAEDDEKPMNKSIPQ